MNVLMFITGVLCESAHADLTDNPAVPALQCRGGTSDRTVGAVPVASLAGHGRGEG